MLTCKQLVKNADAYLAKDLTSWQRLKIKMHLLLCHKCRRYIRKLRLLKGWILCLSNNNTQVVKSATLVDDIQAKLK
jgi:hypothetical protein